MDKKQSKQKIESLVQTFHTEKQEKMNEAETRLRFIDPFFEALGWNIRNPREVRIETPASRSDSTRPDYRFLIDGKTKFFVEAKKPSVKLTDPTPVFQAKSYGFSSKVPIVILTDFEEFRPFRTLARPKYEKPLDGLIREFDLTYDRYVDQFNLLYDTFSHDAVFAGELEKRIPTEKKEASTTVDKEFLKDLSKWQEELAKNIALRNSNLSVSEINEAVQRILDRIIFLRICEDRQIEESEILLSYANSGDDIYRRLLKEFTRLRAKYNGLIFNEHPLSEQLSIDDKLLKEIIVNLYLPRSPYRFNVIPIEILGTIYEQYLGKVITLTPTHRVKVEVKPEVRKAGGVFYTPQFITSCIVKNTIGKLIAGKTPEQIAKLKFIDITCGSGSFCLEMFDYLIHYHIDYYSASPDKIKIVGSVPDAFQTSEAHLPDGQGLWHLSTRKKKEILLNNIYGVDIDPQAVEVTQMSLYLKLLEGESAETFGRQLSLELKETILPTLASNIKCGNSLVGMDIKGLGNSLTLEEELRIRPFDWETAFPEIMKSGGFDAIVGNPPYIRIQTMKEWTPIQVEYLKSHYSSASKGNYDIYVVCVERALSLLNKNGKLGYILPHKFFNAQYGESLRALIKNGKHLEKIIHFGDQQIFEGATTYTCLLFLNKSGCEEFTFFKVEDLETWQQTGKAVEAKIKAEKVGLTEWNFAVGEKGELFEKLNKMPVKLGNIAEKIAQGIRTSANEVYVLDLISAKGNTVTAYSKILGRKVNLERRALLLFLQGREIKSYQIIPSNKMVIFPYSVKGGRVELIEEKEFIRNYPKAHAYLRENFSYLRDRENGKFKNSKWYGYGRAQNIELMLIPKILVPDIADRSAFALDENGEYAFTSGYGVILKNSIKESPKYILGLLNSKVLDFYLKSVSTTMRGGFFRYFAQFVEQLPIRAIDFANPEDKAMHDRMVQLVERMLDLHKKKQQANADSEKELFEHQIKATDNEIDGLVYKLYELTEEEIRIVEGK
jgi:type I restriction-modification system DNA methylase subunit